MMLFLYTGLFSAEETNIVCRSKIHLSIKRYCILLEEAKLLSGVSTSLKINFLKASLAGMENTRKITGLMSEFRKRIAYESGARVL